MQKIYRGVVSEVDSGFIWVNVAMMITINVRMELAKRRRVGLVRDQSGDGVRFDLVDMRANLQPPKVRDKVVFSEVEGQGIIWAVVPRGVIFD